MRYRRGDSVVHRSGAPFVFSIIIGVVILVVGVGSLAAGDGPALLLMFGFAWLLPGYLYGLRSRVVLTDREIHVYNPLSDHVVDYNQVDAMNFSGEFWFWGTLEIDKGHGLTASVAPGFAGWGQPPGWLRSLRADIEQRLEPSGEAP